MPDATHRGPPAELAGRGAAPGRVRRFGPGLNVLTGETGAGKSILLNAPARPEREPGDGARPPAPPPGSPALATPRLDIGPAPWFASRPVLAADRRAARPSRRSRLDLAANIDTIIMLGVGIWATGVGFGKIAFPTEGGPALAYWFKRNARWIGPLLIGISVVLTLAKRG